MVDRRTKVFIFVLAFVVLFPDWSFGGTHMAATCSYNDVQSAVTAALSGDTVAVPSGNCTWSSKLTITKGIILRGNGPGSTNITANNNVLIQYDPATPAKNDAFTITGFTFNLQNNTGFYLVDDPPAYPQTKIRIHNNIWNNCSYSNPFRVNGPFYGVVDNNIFNGNPHFDIYGTDESDGGEYVWVHSSHYTFGTANNLYFEDNIIEEGNQVSSSGLGGVYAWRYNTIKMTGDLWPVNDNHGNMGAGENWSTLGVEIYGNKLVGNHGFGLTDHRGGKSLVFYNYNDYSGNMELWIREEHCDSLNPPATTSDGQTQHISDTYQWNNRDIGGPAYWTITENLCGSYHIAEDVDFWDYKTSFNGTSGVGCGTLAARPSTCTTGVGYWATNQFCSTVPAASVGKNPIDPISGTLYKCTATNTWTAYYTPYTYPHPLRLEGRQGQMIPNPPSNISVH